MNKITPVAILLAGALISGTQYYIHVDSNKKEIEISHDKKIIKTETGYIISHKSEAEKELDLLYEIKNEVNKKVLILKNECSGLEMAYSLEKKREKDQYEENKTNLKNEKDERSLSKMYIERINKISDIYSNLIEKKDREYHIALATLVSVNNEILKQLSENFNLSTKRNEKD